MTLDAIVVGAGPNGLTAAIVLARAGLSVRVLERAAEIGGGTRTEAFIHPGFLHDICSSVYPLGPSSPIFQTMPLAEHGLEWVDPPLAMAHPLDDGTAAVLYRDIDRTANALGADGDAYRALMQPLMVNWDALIPDLLAGATFPRHPIAMARFGLGALSSVSRTARSRFHGAHARALIAGVGAHAVRPLNSAGTTAFAMMLAGGGHRVGWPFARGGAAMIARALGAYFQSLGGEIEVGVDVTSIDALPPARAILLDVSPRRLASMSTQFSTAYRKSLTRYEYGPGVFKVDWVLTEPVPWAAAECRDAGTLHVGGSLEEVERAEAAPARGEHAERPFVLVAQPSRFDRTRVPVGGNGEVLWGYCHVPNGSTVDMTDAIESQIERFAPGFRDVIAGRHVMNTAWIEAKNPNYVGGDIGGGANSLSQMFFRPRLSLRPWRTSIAGVYVCSSATPPGGGVHGMCGYNAARLALKDVFHLRTQL